MRSIKWVILTLVMSLLSLTLWSQRSNPIDPYGEIGITAGYSYYIGDLNPTQHFGPGKQLAYGGMYRVNLTKRHAIRLQGLRLHVSADDANSDDPNLVNRNLNFRNKMTELSIALEINYHEYKLGKLGQGFTPYLFGGLAYFSMNPETEYKGTYYDLIDFGTEGQFIEGSGASPYKRGQFSIPFGVGIKAGFTKRLALNIEWGLRRTFTDYLDDVSGVYADPREIRNSTSSQLAADLSDQSLQPIGPDGTNTGMSRGNPENKDWYVYTGVILSVRLGKDSRGCWK